MGRNSKEDLDRLLSLVGAGESEYLREEAQRYGTPLHEKLLFARECWRPIVNEGDTEWIEKTIANLQSRIGLTDLYALRFLPEQPDLLAALQQLKASGADLRALTHVVRQAQLSLLGWMVSILDGGHCFEDGQSDNWALAALDDDGNPAKSFGDMKDLIWSLDPNRQAG